MYKINLYSIISASVIDKSNWRCIICTVDRKKSSSSRINISELKLFWQIFYDFANVNFEVLAAFLMLAMFFCKSYSRSELGQSVVASSFQWGSLLNLLQLLFWFFVATVFWNSVGFLLEDDCFYWPYRYKRW